MKQWVNILALLLLLVTTETVVHAQPSIFFEEESFDFGTVTQSDRLEHIFIFKNIGNEPLVIKKITSS